MGLYRTKRFYISNKTCKDHSLNWHLFQRICIQKHSISNILHLVSDNTKIGGSKIWNNLFRMIHSVGFQTSLALRRATELKFTETRKIWHFTERPPWFERFKEYTRKRWNTERQYARKHLTPSRQDKDWQIITSSKFSFKSGHRYACN